MEQIRELTKRLIANSFKELMLQTPFEKITIKMITDHANVIRPTFYNHFHDKYELLEWIVKDEVLNQAKELIQAGYQEEGIKFIFSRFYEERAYYRKAFEVTGQNGFAETLYKLLPEMFSEVAKEGIDFAGSPLLTKELVFQYYASGMITFLRLEMERADNVPLEQFLESYSYLMGHTIYQLVE